MKLLLQNHEYCRKDLGETNATTPKQSPTVTKAVTLLGFVGDLTMTKI